MMALPFNTGEDCILLLAGLSDPIILIVVGLFSPFGRNSRLLLCSASIVHLYSPLCMVVLL